MISDDPKTFSLLMSVYAKENHAYLRECLESLAVQTIKASEVVLVEDGPLTEDLKVVIESFRDVLNIKSICLEKNYGLAYALNAGLVHCSYELIARMDTDDVCLSDRFELQLAFMEKHPNISVCGGYIDERNEDMTKSLNIRRVPLDSKDILSFAKKRSPLSHVTVMYRKSAVLSVGGYPLIYPEDYPLWLLFAVNVLQMANLPQVLVNVRTGDGFIARRGFNIFVGEYEVFKFQKKIGFISQYEFLRNVLIRVVVRLSPVFVRRLFYQFAR